MHDQLYRLAAAISSTTQLLPTITNLERYTLAILGSRSTSMSPMLLADRLTVPDDAEALVFDLDGVLLDTLEVDYALVPRLVRKYIHHADVPRSVIRAHFAHPVPEFWRRVLDELGLDLDDDALQQLLYQYAADRAASLLRLHGGVTDLLAAGKQAGLYLAVVSNNPVDEVRAMLESVGIADLMDLVVGNDTAGLSPKPAPDLYIEAASQLGLPPSRCIVVEDSLLGLESAASAGCYAVGVATGADDFDDLAASEYSSRTYTHFDRVRVVLGRDGVTNKSLVTPNDFVSHMIEHIAWRVGCSIDLFWTSDDWERLGLELGMAIGKFPRARTSAASLGMIDDGSCEARVQESGSGGRLRLHAAGQVDLEWFVGSRCEQLRSGAPLISMLSGIAAGSGLDLDLTVASFEDPHHTWEGVFRALGIALHNIMSDQNDKQPTVVPSLQEPQPRDSSDVDRRDVERGWRDVYATATRAAVCRETAESLVSVDASFGRAQAQCSIVVADSINVDGVAALLDEIAKGSGLNLDVKFEATKLSSSHVVAEDIGLVLGRVIRTIAIERMEQTGIMGAGSNVASTQDLEAKPIRVGLSMEGRKFCKYVPFAQTFDEFRRTFIIGHTLSSGLYTEDLDDFLDGFAGGMQASLIVHVATGISPLKGWPLIFRGLGEAIAELLTVNHDRRALIAGVKATLA